jgi:hypothetical protein
MSVSWYTSRRDQLYKERIRYVLPMAECQARYLDVIQTIGLAPLVSKYGLIRTFQATGTVSPCPRLFIRTHAQVGPLDSNIVTDYLTYDPEVEMVNDHNRNTLASLKSRDVYQPEYGLFWCGIVPYLPIIVLPFPHDQDGDRDFDEQTINGSWAHIAERIGRPDYPICPGDVICCEAATALWRKPNASMNYPDMVQGPQDAGEEREYIKQITDAGVFVVLTAGNDYLWEAADPDRYHAFMPDDYGYESSGALVVTTDQLIYAGKGLGCRPAHSRLVIAPTRYPCGASGWLRGMPVGTSWSAPLVAGTLAIVSHLYRQETDSILSVPELLRAVTSCLTMQESNWRDGLYPAGRIWRANTLLDWLVQPKNRD